MVGRFSLAGLLAGATIMFACGVARAQMPPPLPAEALVDAPDAAKVAFLKAHVVAAGPVTGGLRFDFPAAFYDNKLFLLGESHGVAAPQVLDLELLTHLNARIGLTDYVAEVDPVQGARLNQYLETGDEAVLDRVFDFWTKGGAQWGNTAFEAKVRGVRALNQTLPTDRRIQFIGIDAVQDWPLLAAWVVEQGGQADAAALAGAATNAARAAIAQGWLATVPASPATSRLADRLRGVLEGTSKAIGREAVIFDTYSRVVTGGELGERPAYGLWGMFHVIQGGVNNAQPFAARVAASDLPTARRIVSLAILSLDSAVQIPAPTPAGVQRMRLDNFNIDGPFVKVKGSATLREASPPNAIVLFDIGAEGTPFLSGGDFTDIRTSVGQSFVMDHPERPAASFVQYVGVFRNSDWAPPRPE
ncbi:hypothetical protein QE419_002549 [Brevundimonas vesicularis]|uniref:hypothetical protein n=1 Tax=Brevundimonas vesicularis TaxID=41276 RepID=UPI002788D863|nr:hypothetical protein [Brevundimonas vesicularis]MDQ1193783.1 hypothetical protein [Brevundimonas vesicularis]